MGATTTPRRLLAAGVTLLVGLATAPVAAAAAPDPATVQMRDNRYTPLVKQVDQGQPVRFTNFGQVAHDVVDGTGLDLFATDIAAPPEAVTIDPLPGAGRYVYYCSFHPEMRGRLDVPVVTNRMTVRRGAAVTVRWGPTRATGNLVFDVQRRRPGTTHYVAWRTASLAAATRWWPNTGGRWAIRARVRDTATGETSAWSAPVTLRVR